MLSLLDDQHYHQPKSDKLRNFHPSINKNLRPYEGFCSFAINTVADEVATGAIAKAGSSIHRSR